QLCPLVVARACCLCCLLFWSPMELPLLLSTSLLFDRTLCNGASSSTSSVRHGTA
ncbi:hypothetical protein LPJ72_006340, partial [Coemansia sp. Benny D160-2]